MKQLLLIEDDAWLAELYQAMLSPVSGVELFWAQTAKQALDFFTDNIPDLILLDMFLPQHNGIELLHEIASYVDTQDVPVIIMSAVAEHSFAMTREQWRRYGVVDYLYKPHIKQSLLASLVTKQLLNSRVAL